MFTISVSCRLTCWKILWFAMWSSFRLCCRRYDTAVHQSINAWRTSYTRRRNTSTPLPMNTTGTEQHTVLQYTLASCRWSYNAHSPSHKDFKTSFVVYLWLLHIFSERHSLNENQVRAPMTGMTVQSAWHQNGTASTWRRPRLAQMASRWFSSLMT